jgi:alpha-methylacyl-CoA racemase
MLSDMGADVLRIDRVSGRVSSSASREVMNRGRPSVAVDLKHPAGVSLTLDLVERADVLIEGFRPGVMERIGLGPEPCFARNSKLIYGRMTGWGQDGPMADVAGHDLTYIALCGALHGVGEAGGKPVVPLNLVGDFGGGGMLLAFGVVCALLEAKRSGRGQVVDAAMIDGASILMSMFHGMRAAGFHREERGTNMIDGGAHFYSTYETSDGEHIAVGAIEPQFYAELLQRIGLHTAELPAQMDRAQWPTMKQRFAAVFMQKTRAEWAALLESTDSCVAPVLRMSEAMQHPHLRARANFIELDGVSQPAPAPRFSRTVPEVTRPPSAKGADTQEALLAWGVPEQRLSELRATGAIL